MNRSNTVIDLDNLSKLEVAVMVVVAPIFALVAGIEHIIARLTGLTYNEVNIVVYYLLIPLSWAVMIDYIAGLPIFKSYVYYGMDYFSLERPDEIS